MERRLYRSRRNRVIAGVAGGLGEYFDIDPVFVRVIFVVATFAGASGLLAYVILWIVVPKERFDFQPQPQTQAAEGETSMNQGNQDYDHYHHRQHGSMVGGLVLIVLGGLFLADNYLPHFDFSNTWPVILIAIGIGLVLTSVRRDERKEHHENQ